MAMKYELTNIPLEWEGRTLRRVWYPDTQEFGGWIESLWNLSQEGLCQVRDEAKVWGDARVAGDADVSDRAEVFGRAFINGDAAVFGDASVCDNSLVDEDAIVFDSACVCGNAIVKGDTVVSGGYIVDGCSVLTEGYFPDEDEETDMHTDMHLPEDAAARKLIPLASGCIDYFPDALIAVAELSRKGNDQHNPGKPLHWDRSKSGDEWDCLMRHFVDRGTFDTDGVRHSAKVAWRALAGLQKEIEASRQ